MGELAFAKYAGLTVDIEEYDHTDGKGDFLVRYDGQRAYIDVKTAKKEPYALFVKEGGVSADYYVQGHLEGRCVTFLGMASADAVRNTELQETPYPHRNHVIRNEDLEPIPSPENLQPIG